MTRVDLTQFDCSVARTLDVVGDRWTLLVLRDALYGLRRFEEFQSDLGIARNVLADRLRRLVDLGVMERRPYSSRADRFEYRLTEKGRDLLPVVLAMMRWGDRWASDGEPPVRIVHRTCGEASRPDVTCSACGRALHLHEIVTEPIPPGIERLLRERGAVTA